MNPKKQKAKAKTQGVQKQPVQEGRKSTEVEGGVGHRTTSKSTNVPAPTPEVSSTSTVTVWYLQHSGKGNPTHINVPGDALIDELRDAIGDKLGFSEVERESLNLWKPKEKLFRMDSEGNEARTTWDNKKSAPNARLDAIATKLQPDQAISSELRLNTGKRLVHVIVLTELPERKFSRKRHNTEDTSQDPKRPKTEIGGSPKLDSSDRSRTTSGESDHSSNSQRSTRSQEHPVLKREAHRELDKNLPSYLKFADDRRLFLNVLSESLDAYKNTESPLIAEEARSEAWKERSYLRDILLRCREKWSFEELREHPDLHEKPMHAPTTTPWLLEDSREATRRAWTIDYVGDSAMRLTKTVERISLNHSMPYSNTMPIIQSSGTGKSRMVDEMAKYIFTLPFKLAPMGGNGATYPESDETIRHHITSGIANTRPTRHELTAKYLIFFASLFSVVAKEVNDIRGDSPRVSPSEWRAHLEKTGKRASLYSLAAQGMSTILEDVVDNTRKRIQRKTASLEQRTTRKSPPHPETFATKDLHGSPPSCEGDLAIAGETFRDCASEAVKKPIQQLQQAIHPLEEANNTIVLYFDESHILFEFETSEHSTYYHGLLSAFNALRSSKIIGLFLSTTSYLEKYAPTYDMMPSGRAQAAALQPPYTELPFDCHSSFFPVAQNKFTVDALSTPEFQTKFGRPLFWSRYERGNDSIRVGIIDFAREKLLCSPSLASPYSPSSQSARSSRELQELAVLDMRIMLDFGPHREANIVQQHLIERHMRIAVTVPAHREYFYSGYTSEPLLAEAAARIMATIREEQNDDDDTIARMLHKYTTSGLISKGNRGEMVARLLLTLALDKAQMSSQVSLIDASASKAAINYSQAVLVKDFLVALLGEEQWERIKTARPDNTLGESLEDAFKYAKVRFTHFGRASDDSASTSAAAFLAMLRGMAFQCCPQQPVIDIVIPVFLDNESSTATVCEERMTALLIQVKNRMESSIIAQVAIDEAAVHFFPEGSAWTERRPYISIVMDLGIQPVQIHKYAKESQHIPMENEGEGREATHTPPSLDISSPLSLVAPSTPSKVIIGREKSRESPRVAPAHLRYSLYIHGCSPTVYSVIGSRDVYANLLESRNMFSEHSRPENLDVIKGMKVLWGRGPECYGFGQNCPAVQEVRGQEVEGVNVGR